MKNLYIFKDYESKFSTQLSDYSKDTLTFQGFIFANNNDKQLKDLHLTYKGQKAKNIEKIDRFPTFSKKKLKDQ